MIIAVIVIFVIIVIIVIIMIMIISVFYGVFSRDEAVDKLKNFI